MMRRRTDRDATGLSRTVDVERAEVLTLSSLLDAKDLNLCLVGREDVEEAGSTLIRNGAVYSHKESLTRFHRR